MQYRKRNEHFRKLLIYLHKPGSSGNTEIMLYLLCLNQPELLEKNQGFQTVFDALGPSLELFPGCLMVDSVYTAQGIREQLEAFLSRTSQLLIVRMFQDMSAGVLPAQGRQFVAQHISPNPIPPCKDEMPYSF